MVGLALLVGVLLVLLVLPKRRQAAAAAAQKDINAEVLFGYFLLPVTLAHVTHPHPPVHLGWQLEGLLFA